MGEFDLWMDQIEEITGSVGELEKPDLPSLLPSRSVLEDYPHEDLQNEIRRLLSVDALLAFPEWHHQYRRKNSYPQPPEAIIEIFVVDLLCKAQKSWGPKYQYVEVVAKTGGFPDVRLLLQGKPFQGIEVKAGDTTCKEWQPTFRFPVSPLACAPQDLIVYFPYHWELVFPRKGDPLLLKPWVEEARYAAAYRNAAWERDGGEVTLAQSPRPYPEPREKYNDRALNDSGSNFGRLGRTGLMRQYLHEIGSIEYAADADLQRHTLKRWHELMWG